MYRSCAYLRVKNGVKRNRLQDIKRRSLQGNRSKPSQTQPLAVALNQCKSFLSFPALSHSIFPLFSDLEGDQDLEDFLNDTDSSQKVGRKQRSSERRREEDPVSSYQPGNGSDER